MPAVPLATTRFTLRGSLLPAAVAVMAPAVPIVSDAEIAMRLQLEEMGAGAAEMPSQHIAALTAGAVDAAFAQQLALNEAGVTETFHRLISCGPAEGGGGSSGGGSSSTSFAASFTGRSQRLFLCGICMERVPLTDLTPCGGAGCTHAFCTPCLRGYVSSRVTDRRYPVLCVDTGCTVPLPYEVCRALVAGTGATEGIFSRVHIEATFIERPAYCANPACATPFDFELGHAPADASPDDDSSELFRVECPLCGRHTCVNCRALWHEGQSCAAHERARHASDALTTLARARKWKTCPGCGVLIDKNPADCNYVRHEECGTAFCFRCGAKYISQKGTAENVHGRPACRCGLWSSPDGRAAAEAQPMPPPRMGDY